MQREFNVYPAIDLRKGQVVRLIEGDPTRQTNYDSNPAEAAKRWLEKGAKWLHVINLDGAFAEKDSANYQALRAIMETAESYNAKVQFGGGLRSLKAVKTVLEMGVTRAIIGTLAVENFAMLQKILQTWGKERIVVSLDARDGMVQIKGWQESSCKTALQVGKELREIGLKWLIFTDIARDGKQSGANLPATIELAKESRLKVIVSGGVKDQQDIDQSREAGLPGIITGKALYEGKFDIDKLFT